MSLLTSLAKYVPPTAHVTVERMAKQGNLKTLITIDL